MADMLTRDTETTSNGVEHANGNGSKDGHASVITSAQPAATPSTGQARVVDNSEIVVAPPKRNRLRVVVPVVLIAALAVAAAWWFLFPPPPPPPMATVQRGTIISTVETT